MPTKKKPQPDPIQPPPQTVTIIELSLAVKTDNFVGDMTALSSLAGKLRDEFEVVQLNISSREVPVQQQ